MLLKKNMTSESHFKYLSNTFPALFYILTYYFHSKHQLAVSSVKDERKCLLLAFTEITEMNVVWSTTPADMAQKRINNSEHLASDSSFLEKEMDKNEKY